MASEAKGIMYVPVWVDGGVVKALVDDNGRISIQLGGSDVSLDVNLQASDITLPVAEQSPLTSIQAQGYGYDGSAWRKQHLIWGYEERLSAYATVVVSGAVTEMVELFVVPAGYIYILQASMSINRDTVVDQHHLIHDGNHYFSIRSFVAQPTTLWAINDKISYVLKEGDALRFQFVACSNLDDLDVSAWGYRMALAM